LKTVLKEVRQQMYLTQKQIADEVNISILSYQRYEAGKRSPNVYTALLIAKILNTTVEKLFL